jgi:hypothetical protein
MSKPDKNLYQKSLTPAVKAAISSPRHSLNKVLLSWDKLSDPLKHQVAKKILRSMRESTPRGTFSRNDQQNLINQGSQVFNSPAMQMSQVQGQFGLT